jgi:hypothetical protein
MAEQDAVIWNRYKVRMRTVPGSLMMRSLQTDIRPVLGPFLLTRAAMAGLAHSV